MSTRPLRILVVDDDPAMVGAITALVGTEGHQVITAYDGLTAVKRFREERPDLVLLDLAMPGPDGFTVAGQIRAAGQSCQHRTERDRTQQVADQEAYREGAGLHLSAGRGRRGRQRWCAQRAPACVLRRTGCSCIST